MKHSKHNRNLLAIILAAGFGLAGNGALAMTGEHDTVPSGKDGTGATVADSDSGKRLGGRVGELTLKDFSQ